MTEKHKNKSITILATLVVLIIIISIVLFVFQASKVKKQECDSYSVEECPGSCVVCPPCAACSSISCRSEEFCKDIGFNRTWYEDIKERLDK